MIASLTSPMISIDEVASFPAEPSDPDVARTILDSLTNYKHGVVHDHKDAITKLNEGGLATLSFSQMKWVMTVRQEIFSHQSLVSQALERAFEKGILCS